MAKTSSRLRTRVDLILALLFLEYPKRAGSSKPTGKSYAILNLTSLTYGGMDHKGLFLTVLVL